MPGIQEIEVRFLEINPDNLKSKLKNLRAQDLGEDYFKEILFYHTDPVFSDNQKRMVRIRQNKDGITLTYKHNLEHSATGTKEIEFSIDNIEKAQMFLEENGWLFSRFVEKKRHSFLLNNVQVDIDFYPKIPPFVEIEGESEEALKETAKLLELDWKDVEFRSSRVFIIENYKIPLDTLKYYTFDKVE